MPLSREQLMAHLDKKFSKFEESSTGNKLDYARPADPLTWGETAKAVGAGILSAPAWAGRFAGEAGYAVSKIGQGVTSGFGLAPNSLSEALRQRAEDVSASGQFLAGDVERKMGVYDSFGAKREQARAVGRTTQDIASSFLAPVGGAAKGGALGAKLGVRALGWAGAPAGRVGAAVGRGAAFGTLAGGEYGAASGAYGAAKEGKNVLGGAVTGAAQGALGGAIMGGALPAIGKLGRTALTPVEGTLGRAEEGARGLFNRAQVAIGRDETAMVGVRPTVFGKVAKAEGIAAENAQVSALRSQPVFGKTGQPGLKVNTGGGGTSAEAEQTAQLAAEIAAARDPLGKVTPDAMKMAQVAQAFQLPKVRGFAQMEANHRTIVDGIDTVGQVIGKEIPADTVQALKGVQKAKEKLMPVITEANAKVTGSVAKEEAVAVADGILSTPEVDAELLAQGISSESVRSWAAQLAGRSQQDLQRIKNSLSQSVNGKKVGQYQGATEDALKLRVVSQLMDDRVVAALGQSNKPVSQQLAKLNAFEKHLAGVASVDLRKADASLSVILSNALAHGDLGSAKTGLWKAGWAKAAGMLDKVRGKNNLISSVYEDVFKGGQPSGAFKVAQMGDVKAPQATPAVTKTYKGSTKLSKTQSELDAAEASASLREGSNGRAIGGGGSQDNPLVAIDDGRFTPDSKPEEILSFAKQNENDIIAAYKAKHGNVINTDDVRPAFGGDRGVPASTTHEASSYLAKKMLADSMDEAAARSKAAGRPEQFVILAGGGGSGKNFASQEARKLAEKMGTPNPVTWDGTSSNYGKAVKMIEDAKAKGLDPVVYYTHRKVGDAWENGVVKRTANQNAKKGMGNGRAVQFEVFKESHEGARQTALKLHENGYEVHFMDNSGPKGTAKEISPEQAAKAFSEDKISDIDMSRVRSSVAKRLEEGSITEAQARNLLKGAGALISKK